MDIKAKTWTKTTLFAFSLIVPPREWTEHSPYRTTWVFKRVVNEFGSRTKHKGWIVPPSIIQIYTAVWFGRRGTIMAPSRFFMWALYFIQVYCILLNVCISHPWSNTCHHPSHSSIKTNLWAHLQGMPMSFQSIIFCIDSRANLF